MSNEKVTETPEAPTHEFLVQINYKSGNQHLGWFTKFEVKTSGGKISSMTWAVKAGGVEQPVLIGVDDIESVFQLNVMPIEKQ